jgi:hypothetical protein
MSESSKTKTRTMTRRRIALIGLGVLGVVTVAFMAIGHSSLSGQPGQAAYHQIRIGMTEEEVLAVVKMPPSPHGMSGLERISLELVAEERTCTCWNNRPFTAHVDHYTLRGA